ncbi:MAG: hypothetical protein, partial [Olavius algarvensis Gamma 1 endosymbiont]
DVTEVIILRQREEFGLRMIRRRGLAATDGDKQPLPAREARSARRVVR